MIKTIASFKRSESGATLVEYGIALLVAVVVGGVLITGLATEVRENVTRTQTEIQAGQTAAGGTF